MAPPTRAVQAIQSQLIDWLGASDRTGEAAVTAEVKRLRAELARLKVAAGDAPSDPAEVLAELRGLLVPWMRDIAHLMLLRLGHLPDLGSMAPGWHIVCTALVSGTQSRSRFGPCLESLEIVQGLTAEALELLGGFANANVAGSEASGHLVGSGASLSSWQAVDAAGPPQEGADLFGPDDEDENDQDLQEALSASMEQRNGASLFAGTRGFSAPDQLPAASWIPSHPGAQTPRGPRPAEQFDIASPARRPSGAQVEAVAEEEEQAATSDPYPTPLGSGRSESSPRQFMSSIWAWVDEALLSQLAALLAAVGLISTPVLSSAVHIIGAVGFAVVVTWRHFVRMSMAMTAFAAAGATATWYFLSELLMDFPAWIVGYVAVAVCAAGALRFLWPGNWGTRGEAHVRVHAWTSGLLSIWSTWVMGAVRAVTPDPRPLPTAPDRQVPPRRLIPPILPGAQLAARQSEKVSLKSISPLSSLGHDRLSSTPPQSHFGQSPLYAALGAAAGPVNHLGRVGPGLQAGLSPFPGAQVPGHQPLGGHYAHAGAGQGHFGLQQHIHPYSQPPAGPGYPGGGGGGPPGGPGNNPFPGSPAGGGAGGPLGPFGGPPPWPGHGGGGFPPPGGGGGPPPGGNGPHGAQYGFPPGGPSGPQGPGAGPSGPPGGPPGGWGQDPYLHGGWGSSIPSQRKRIAHDTYWEIRRQATSVRNYMSSHYPGSRGDQQFHDLWALAELTDIRVDAEYQAGGVPRLNGALQNDDSLEHMLSRIGGQVAYIRTGDRRVFDALSTSKPPGQSDIVPEWALSEARDHSKQLFNEELRVSGRVLKQATPVTPSAKGAAAAGTPPQAAGPPAGGAAAAGERKPRRRGKNPPTPS